jgi:hypothetical protein
MKVSEWFRLIASLIDVSPHIYYLEYPVQSLHFGWPSNASELAASYRGMASSFDESDYAILIEKDGTLTIGPV